MRRVRDTKLKEAKQMELAQIPPNPFGISEYKWGDYVREEPKLAELTRISEVSTHLFGVASLSFLVPHVDIWTSRRIKEFFTGNHSDMVAWAKEAKPKYGHIEFLGRPDLFKTYKDMVRFLGLELAVCLSQDRDFADICRGYSLYKKKLPSLLKSLQKFPKSTWSKAIHDYLDTQMKRAENKRTVSEPLPYKELPETLGEFRVLVPKKVSDLKAIGNAQGHCVGTKQMGYADKVKRGQVYILALYTKTLADGICIELDASSGSVLQVQGKGRRAPKHAEIKAIGNLILELGLGLTHFLIQQENLLKEA